MAGPESLGRYKIERILGRGAMGVVYEALDPKLHRTVAIKTILISQLDEETAKDFSMRFVREAHAVARLNHPNIVQVYDFGEEGDVAYLVMEYIRGNELKSALATGPTFDRKESVRIMCELLDALDFAHEQGVIHRDIKPANVMLDTQGRVKLTDFGVARVTDADRTSAERTQAGTMVGTPAYMSPEQIQGHRVDRRSDIFSAGIILYQFLTGQKPFTGEGAWTVAKKIIQDDPPTPSSLNVAVSPQLDQIVAKALAKRPEERYATAREFASDLRSVAAGRAPASAEPTVVVPRATETPPAQRSGEMDLEFWRSIKDSDDPNDFELYLRQFPKGVYASLAGRRLAKLGGSRLEAGAESSNTVRVRKTDDGDVENAIDRIEPKLDQNSMTEKTLKLGGTFAGNAVPELVASREIHGPKSRWWLAILLLFAAVAAYVWLHPELPIPAIARLFRGEGAPTDAGAAKKSQEEAAMREAEARKSAEAAARRDAENRAKQEAMEQARRQAEARAREDAAKLQRDAELKAQREQAQREVDLRAKAAAEAQAQRNARAKARQEAEAQREAEAQAKREADLRQKHEAEIKAQREAEAARREADLRAKREAAAAAKREADAKAKLAAEETALWNSIRRGTDPAGFQNYLKRYPKGTYADEARKRLAALESAQAEEKKRAEQALSKPVEHEAAPKRKPVIVPPSF